LLGDGLMPTSAELGLHLAQLPPHPPSHRPPSKQETSGPRLRANVREAEEVERFRLAETMPGAVRSGGAPELEQTGLVGVQLQGELCESLAKLLEEPLGV